MPHPAVTPRRASADLLVRPLLYKPLPTARSLAMRRGAARCGGIVRGTAAWLSSVLLLLSVGRLARGDDATTASGTPSGPELISLKIEVQDMQCGAAHIPMASFIFSYDRPLYAAVSSGVNTSADTRSAATRKPAQEPWLVPLGAGPQLNANMNLTKAPFATLVCDHDNPKLFASSTPLYWVNTNTPIWRAPRRNQPLRSELCEGALSDMFTDQVYERIDDGFLMLGANNFMLYAELDINAELYGDGGGVVANRLRNALRMCSLRLGSEPGVSGNPTGGEGQPSFFDANHTPASNVVRLDGTLRSPPSPHVVLDVLPSLIIVGGEPQAGTASVLTMTKKNSNVPHPTPPASLHPPSMVDIGTKEPPLSPKAPFLSGGVGAAGAESFPDFIDQMCNYVMGLVPSMLCLNTKAAKECYDQLMQDSQDPPASLIADFQNTIAEDSTNRAGAAASLGQYEASFFSNFGDAKLPYLVELSATKAKTGTRIKATSREGLQTAVKAATSLGLKSLSRLRSLEAATLHLSARQKQTLYAAKECEVLAASQMTHAEHYQKYVNIGYTWYINHEEKATELAEKWQSAAAKLRSAGEHLQRARIRVLRMAQRHAENVNRITEFLDESASSPFAVAKGGNANTGAHHDKKGFLYIPTNLTRNATLAKEILSRITTNTKGNSAAAFTPARKHKGSKEDTNDGKDVNPLMDPLMDLSGTLDRMDNATTMLLEQQNLARASLATRQQSRRALATLVEEVSSRHRRGLAVSHIEQDDWIKLGNQGDSGPLGLSQKRIIKDMAQEMTGQMAAELPNRVVEDLEAMVEQLAAGEIMFTLPKLLGRNVARMLGRSLVATLSYTVPTIVSRLLPPYLIRALENTLTTSITLGLTHTLSTALTYTLARTPAERQRCHAVCIHVDMSIPQSLARVECAKCQLAEQQSDQNLRPTEWQASYYSDYYAAYFNQDENLAGGKLGDTIQLEEAIATDEKEEVDRVEAAKKESGKNK